MTWRRRHSRERPSHPDDDLRPHEAMRVPMLISSRALARGISGPWMPRGSGGIEDARFLHQQANCCYQLAWQCFDLAVAHKLNLMGNELTAKARKGRQTQRRQRAEANLDQPARDDGEPEVRQVQDEADDDRDPRPSR